MQIWNKLAMPRRRTVGGFLTLVLLSAIASIYWYSFSDGPAPQVLPPPPLLPLLPPATTVVPEMSAIRRERLRQISMSQSGNIFLSGNSRGQRYTYATFLADYVSDGAQKQNPSDDDDMYFVASRVLGYKLMHDEKTRSQLNISFVVGVTDAVSESKRARLEKDGAIVVPIEGVKLPSWIRTGVRRWKDQFIKLRLFELVEYDLILFIDADTLVRHPLDGVFTDPAVVGGPKETLRQSRKSQIKQDEAPIPEQYIFAARADNFHFGARRHSYPPPLHGKSFSAGFWIAKPSFDLFDYYYSVMQQMGRFDPSEMEQSLLNYAHRRSGPMPWGSLGTSWSATRPNERDFDGGCASLHEKFWNVGPPRLQTAWWEEKAKMEKFYRERDAI